MAIVILASRTRPDLVRDAPYIRWLPLLGAVWLIFTLILYWFAGVGPILNAISGGQQALAYLNSSGVTFVIIVFVVGIAYIVWCEKWPSASKNPTTIWLR